MRILVVSIGTTGDVLPFIAMAAELGRRGHDVTLSSAETFGTAAARAGVQFEPLMTVEDYREVFEHPSFWRPFLGARRLFKALPRFLRPTYEFVRDRRTPGDTVVIASALAIGARVAQEALDVPVVSVHLTPIMFISRDEPPRTPYLPLPKWLPAAMRWRMQTGLYTEFIAPLLKPGLNAFRQEVGLKPKRRIRSWWHSSKRMMLLFPDWFAPRQADWPRQSVQFDFPRADRFGAASEGLSPELEAFLAAGEPPVAVTFGSARFGSSAMYQAAVEACRALGKRCLVLSQQPIEGAGGDRPNVLFSPYAPLGDVLPRCAALVHHGGIGTVSRAFAAGVPQLVVPMAFDQFDHAARVARLGCGAWTYRSRFTAPKAERLIGDLLASREIAETCREVARRSDPGDVIARVCDEIEREFGRPEPASSSAEHAARFGLMR